MCIYIYIYMYTHTNTIQHETTYKQDNMNKVLNSFLQSFELMKVVETIVRPPCEPSYTITYYDVLY